MKVREGALRDVLRLFVWYPFRWMTAVLPVRWSLLLFKLMGDLHWGLGRWKGGRAQANISRLLNAGPAEAAAVQKGIFELHYLDRLHIFLYPRLRSWERLKRFVSFENIEVLEKEMSKGKGVLVVQPHFGPVQITLLALALTGHNPLQIGYPTDKGLSRIGRSVAYRFRLRYEAMLPAPIHPADGFLGSVYKHLKKGGVVLTTGDGAGGGTYLGEHRECDFLGGRRLLPLGPAALALRTGASYLPTFIIPDRYDSFRIVFGEPITRAGDDDELDKAEMTGGFAEAATRRIRQHPHCWHFWDEGA